MDYEKKEKIRMIMKIVGDYGEYCLCQGLNDPDSDRWNRYSDLALNKTFQLIDYLLDIL